MREQTSRCKTMGSLLLQSGDNGCVAANGRWIVGKDIPKGQIHAKFCHRMDAAPEAVRKERRMNHVVKIIGTIVLTFAILGLPVLTYLSFAFEWNAFLRLVFVVSVVIEAILVSAEVYERSEE